MEINTFAVFYQASIIVIYGGIILICILFTFFLDKFERLNGILNLEFLSKKILTPLERNIGTFDDWLIAHNRVAGPALIFLAFLDLQMLSKFSLFL